MGWGQSAPLHNPLGRGAGLFDEVFGVALARGVDMNSLYSLAVKYT